MTHPVGTRLWFVPIRFWEESSVIETGYVARNTDFAGNTLNSYGERDVFAFHDGYGHDVYVQIDRVCYSLDEAERRKAERAAEQKRVEEAEFEKFWQEKLLPLVEAKRKGN